MTDHPDPTRRLRCSALDRLAVRGSDPIVAVSVRRGWWRRPVRHTLAGTTGTRVAVDARLTGWLHVYAVDDLGNVVAELGDYPAGRWASYDVERDRAAGAAGRLRRAQTALADVQRRSALLVREAEVALAAAQRTAAEDIGTSTARVAAAQQRYDEVSR